MHSTERRSATQILAVAYLSAAADRPPQIKIPENPGEAFLQACCVAVPALGVSVGQSTPRWELYGGYQLTGTDIGVVQDLANSLTVPNHLPQVNVGRNLNLNGGNFSVEENPASWWGGIIDFSGSYVSKHINLSQVAQAAGLVPAGATAIATFRPTLYTIAAGPQFTYRKAGKIQPFARIMLGAAHSDLGADGLTKSALDVFAPTFQTTSTSFALMPGIGADYVWRKYLAFRVTGDYIRTYLFTEHQGNFRLSAGVHFRIGSR